ncbi:MAG: GGDEF domain-containing protein [Candidatus Rokubacteria bacterium]|nr:GGDEF domain-containing protein [Candidatus Rokubacteria bacterium]
MPDPVSQAPPAAISAAAPASPATPVRRQLTLALIVAAALVLVSGAHLVLPSLLPAGTASPRPVSQTILGITAFLGSVLLLGALYRARDRAGRSEAPPAPASVSAPAAAQPTDVDRALGTLLDPNRADEVGALMREFTRILGVLQEQASQVQDYAARFEVINEELRNANLRLRELSLTDELTEVGNRRNFDVRMREEINRSTRFGHTFSLLLLDIDRFKKFNDEFGHPQGDAVLRALGALMRSLSREGDVPCRIGGEEFAFILPETAKADAMGFAERIRRAVEGTIRAPDGQHPLTVSIGLAGFPEDGKSPEDLVRASDEALYESKNGGRNRVTAYLRK